ncbi:hypothetical protein BH11BAC7_BH11BAC7_30360 [soil metagenome]
MKTKLLFPLGLVILCCNFSFGQAPLTPSQWENGKKAGTLDKSAKLQSSGDTLNYAIAPNSPNQQPASTSCAC